MRIHRLLLATTAAIGLAIPIGAPAAPVLDCAPTETTTSTSAQIKVEDPSTCELDPLLTRTSLRPVYESGSGNNASENRLAALNLTSFAVDRVAGSRFQFSFTTQSPWPRSLVEAPLVPAPFTGLRVMTLFKSSPIWLGGVSSGDNFHWYVFGGVSATSLTPDTPLTSNTPRCALGYYDPLGFYTDLFDTSTASSNMSCSYQPTTNKMTITVPYVVTWRDHVTGVTGSVPIVTAGSAIFSIKAVSMAEHRAPQLYEYQWYSDALPRHGFTTAPINTDPMATGVPGPTCGRILGWMISNPLYSGGPCYQPVPARLGGGPADTVLSITS